MPNNLLLTGRPGVGKTTVIRRVAEALGAQAGGFYTEEVRWGRDRIGFRIMTLDGRTTWLAHRDWRSRYRIGKYGVNLEGLEELAIPALWEALARKQVVLIDEIGPMELLSPAFVHAVMSVLDSERILVATIMAKPHPWADAVKKREDVTVWTVTRENRDRLPEEVVAWIKEVGKAGQRSNVTRPPSVGV